MKSNEELQRHASELLLSAKSHGSMSLRLLGGVAIRRLFPDPAVKSTLDRICKDLDFAVSRRESKGLAAVFSECGFEADRHFNALHGETRLLFAAGELQADVFVNEFEQCHKLSLEPRLRVIEESLPPADLLLMKLQVVEMNEKDLQDLCVILLGAEIGRTDSPTVINLDYVTALMSRDWGWYTTCMDSLGKLSDYVTERLSSTEQEMILAKIRDLERLIEACPKSVKWKMRNAVGRKVPWYQVPEEVRR